MSIQSDIEAKLTNHFDLRHLEVINESDNHNVPPGSESHFKVVLVSPDFEGKGLVMRHRAVNQVLAAELADKIHALALHTWTEDDWFNKAGNVPMSPPCLGGSSDSTKT